MNIKISSFVLIAVISSTCGATTLFSNFGPSQSYNQFPAIAIAGSDAPLLGRDSLAASFSPSTTATLDSIDLAVRSNGGTPTFTIEIAEDSAGIPGTILETLSLSGIPSTTTIESVTSVTHPLISSGATYWVVVLPGDPSTNGTWSTNNLITIGNWDFSNDNGATWNIETTGATPVFDVNGTAAAVPEPSSALLFFGGLGTILVYSRRRTFRDQKPQNES